MNTGILMMLLSSIRGLGRVERKTRLVLGGGATISIAFRLTTLSGAPLPLRSEVLAAVGTMLSPTPLSGNFPMMGD